MTKVFMTGAYRKHREQVLFDRERSLLPTAMPLVSMSDKYACLKKETEAADEAAKSAREKLSSLQYDLRHASLELVFARNQVLGTTTDDGERVAFVSRGHCPRESCNSFIGENWSCCVCKTKVCSHCLEITEEDHVCNTATTESVKAIRSECRPCPKCHVRIFRVDGCAQMWCTQCQCAFSWTTGKEIKVATLHNPHYTEWQRRQHTNAIVGNICNRPATYSEIQYCNPSRSCVYNDRHLISDIISIARRLEEMRDNEGQLTRRFQMKSLSTRVHHIRGKSTPEQFKTAIQRTDKARSKNEERSHILGMFIDIVSDIIVGYVNGITPIKEVYPSIKSAEKFTNDCLIEMAEGYGTNADLINF